LPPAPLTIDVLHLARWRWLLACALAISIAATASGETVRLQGRTMGTTYHVSYWTVAADEPTPSDLQHSIDALLARFDERMSTWRDDSELSRFNAAPAKEWFPVSQETATVVSRAIELHRVTDGASDVTVGPILRLWGFGPQAKAPLTSAPNDEALENARQLVGADRLQVQATPPALCKEVEGLEVDLSSIAPGYAIDLIVDLLAESGIDNAMVELGGEVRGVGLRDDAKPWRVGVQGAPPHERTVVQIVPLKNLALATSGDYHNFHDVNGVAYAHIIDPRSGRPLRYRGAAVTVVAEKCFDADGVATALFVMGADDGYKWCVEHDTAALFQEPNHDGPPAVRRTPRFIELVGPAR
jgi:FAD:protein FMN transferase